MGELTHINKQGRAKMVNVGEKNITERVAEAVGYVLVNKETFDMIKNGGNKKGEVLGTAQVAGIMAAKKTSEIIPMCHPILITGVDMNFELTEVDNKHGKIKITSKVSCTGKTGVEMEAMTAVSVAALTIYDMCKAVQKDIYIEDIHLFTKCGGKSGTYYCDTE
ncbi:MAG: cyclic pyranopterin monophosphate synthase MoaC [Aminipila sp.]